ncbi:hypothetical protein H5410_063434 [Solanum commersonii]|uniref:Uncharacterized protein n=1 Tax=Solanum commersonii TaxID=4109 RepID=A0A9J5WEG9_SOLCO|nr:hypothetical protein H5410_063434 [Solanum commersonii]
MKLTTCSLATNSISPLLYRNSKSASIIKWVPQFQPIRVKFRVDLSNGSARLSHSSVRASSPAIQSDVDSKLQIVEETIEKVIYSCRFFAILAVWGSLIGSFLCFIKGCTYVTASFQEYFRSRANVILLLVEAIALEVAINACIRLGCLHHTSWGAALSVQTLLTQDALRTVMLVFGMGLYELFISNLDKLKSTSEENSPYQSNLFGIFTLKLTSSGVTLVFNPLGFFVCFLISILTSLSENPGFATGANNYILERPRWLEIKTISGMKTKVGHVIVMLLLIGLFEKSKKAVINTPLDLLCFSASVLLCSGCLYLLSRLTEEH